MTEQRPSEVPFKIMTAAAVAATVVVRAHYEKGAGQAPKVTAPDPKADTLPSYALAATLLSR